MPLLSLDPVPILETQDSGLLLFRDNVQLNYDKIQDIVNRLDSANIRDGSITGADIASEAWNTYTPVWTASGVAPALNNGILFGRYTRIGRTIHGILYLAIGTTTTVGTGVYYWSLPVVGQGAFVWQAIGVAKGWGNGPSFSELARIFGDSANNKVVVTYSNPAPAGGETQVGQGTPWNWLAGMDLSLCFTYEAAS